MKKLSALLLCLLLAFGLPLASLRAAHAEGEFRTDIYHFNDFEGVVTQDEADRIDDLVYDFIEKYGVDLPVFIASDTGDEDPFDAMERIYYGNQLGYGGDTRINIPGTATGNWQVRFSKEDLDGIDNEWFRELNRLYRR